MELYEGCHRLSSVLRTAREGGSPLSFSLPDPAAEHLKRQLREALSSDDLEELDVDADRLRSLVLEIETAQRGWLSA